MLLLPRALSRHAAARQQRSIGFQPVFAVGYGLRLGRSLARSRMLSLFFCDRRMKQRNCHNFRVREEFLPQRETE
jgi:hypothetical protein